jgi:hypothetical protein
MAKQKQEVLVEEPIQVKKVEVKKPQNLNGKLKIELIFYCMISLH